VDPEKKSLAASERDEAQRQAFREQLGPRAAAALVIVDESGTNLNLTPLYARAPRGARVYGQVPRNTPKNTTLIASLTWAGMGPAMTLAGATDTAAFVAYLEQVFAPTLRPGQIVVLDNLSAHKSEQGRRLIEARGAELWYLPAYSPDLSPIEQAFSKLKTLLRRAKPAPARRWSKPSRRRSTRSRPPMLPAGSLTAAIATRRNDCAHRSSTTPLGCDRFGSPPRK
jgi:transposase